MKNRKRMRAVLMIVVMIIVAVISLTVVYSQNITGREIVNAASTIDTGMLVNLSALSLAIIGVFISLRRKKK